MKTIRNDKQRNELIEKHIPFAKQLAKQFYFKRQRAGFDLDDIESAALLGLCDAAGRFDVSRGMSFRTFAYFRIRGSMYDTMRYGSGIPRRQFNRLVPARPEPHTGNSDDSSTLEDQSDKGPYSFARSPRELVGMVGSIDDYPVQIVINSKGEAETAYREQATPEEEAAQRDIFRFVLSYLEELPEREAEVIRLRYVEGKSFQEIAAELGGVSKSWVSRIHKNALKTLRTLVAESGAIDAELAFAA